MKMETDYSLKGGSILMDAPVKHDMEKLVESAHDREEWRARVNELKSQVYKQWITMPRVQYARQI